MRSPRHALDITPSWDEGPPGSAGVPPAKHWHSLTHLLDPARPAAAPGFCFSRAQAVSAGRVAGRRITGKLSGHPTQRMRAGRPRSRRGASSHPSCSERRHCPCRCGRTVPLRVPSSSFVCLRGFLFFCFRQANLRAVRGGSASRRHPDPTAGGGALLRLPRPSGRPVSGHSPTC